jgi:hypothetical protein
MRPPIHVDASDKAALRAALRGSRPHGARRPALEAGLLDRSEKILPIVNQRHLAFWLVLGCVGFYGGTEKVPLAPRGP